VKLGAPAKCTPRTIAKSARQPPAPSSPSQDEASTKSSTTPPATLDDETSAIATSSAHSGQNRVNGLALVIATLAVGLAVVVM
jgi:uncharacterized protein HemX